MRGDTQVFGWGPWELVPLTETGRLSGRHRRGWIREEKVRSSVWDKIGLSYLVDT